MLYFSNSNLKSLLFSTAVVALIPFSSIAQSNQAVATSGAQASVSAGIVWPELANLLTAAGSDAAAIRSVYQARNFAPVWMTQDAAAARALVEAFINLPAHGLPAAGDRLAEMNRYIEGALDGAPVADGELAFAKAYIEYGQMITSGLLTPNRIDREIHVFPDVIPGDALLASLVRSTDPAVHIASLSPSAAGYSELMDVLADLRIVVSQGGWAGGDIPSGATLRAGDRDARMPQIRSRLQALGTLEAVAPVAVSVPTDTTALEGDPAIAVQSAVSSATSSTVMDAQVVAALEDFQARHGLNTDGVIGPKTLEALNASADERLRQVLVNLERARWTTWDDSVKHIYVNLPDYNMWLREAGQTIFTTRVVIGKRQHQTTEFSDTMTHMVVNPTWTVPRSIATEEILPQLQANPNYLNERNMELIDDGSGVWTPPDTSLINWAQFSQNNFPWWIRQGPGANNALGNVKFMFPNQFAIYLHDTPSRSLFARDARAFSHGCVRVADPVGLAEVLLEPQTENPRGLFDRYRERGTETRVNLDSTIPVHLDYRTVWVNEVGQVQFREDVYGRDAQVYDALRNAGVEAFPAQG